MSQQQQKFQRNTCKTCQNACALNTMEKMAETGYQCWHPVGWFTALQAARDEITTLKQQLHDLHEKYMNALPCD